jgi:hypothetical protein
LWRKKTIWLLRKWKKNYIPFWESEEKKLYFVRKKNHMVGLWKKQLYLSI